MKAKIAGWMRAERLSLLAAAVIMVSGPALAADQALPERLALSTAAFEELMASADSKVPSLLLINAEAVAIFPRTINVALGLGGQYGRGVAFKHDKRSGRWSAPAFYTIGGLTMGPQIGGQAIDIVLIIGNKRGLDSLIRSKCTLGGDAGIAVGPVGRNAAVNTDLLLTSEILSYSRAKGLYAGLSLKGAVVAPDEKANENYYGKRLDVREIFNKVKGPYPPEGRKLRTLLERHSYDWLRRMISLLYPIAGAVIGIVVCVIVFKRKKNK